MKKFDLTFKRKTWILVFVLIICLLEFNEIRLFHVKNFNLFMIIFIIFSFLRNFLII